VKDRDASGIRDLTNRGGAGLKRRRGKVGGLRQIEGTVSGKEDVKERDRRCGEVREIQKRVERGRLTEVELPDEGGELRVTEERGQDWENKGDKVKPGNKVK